MKQIGKLVTCDRCGAQVFLESARTHKHLDGGFTVYEDYIVPEEWNDWGYKSDVGDLCPACNTLYEETMRVFMGTLTSTSEETCQLAIQPVHFGDNAN